MILKASPRPYIMFGITGLGIPFCAALYFNHQSLADLVTLFFNIRFPLLDMVLLFYIWLSFFKITVSDDKISYRTMFAGTQCMKRSELKKYKFVHTDYDKMENRTKPPFVLHLISKVKGQKPIEINLPVFDAKQFRAFLDILDRDIQANQQWRTRTKFGLLLENRTKDNDRFGRRRWLSYAKSRPSTSWVDNRHMVESRAC